MSTLFHDELNQRPGRDTRLYFQTNLSYQFLSMTKLVRSVRQHPKLEELRLSGIKSVKRLAKPLLNC